MPSSKEPSDERAVWAELLRYNARLVGPERDPALLRLKLDRLCASPFGFLRGTFHLFARDWQQTHQPAAFALAAQPIVGDLHIENFGAYRAAQDVTVFDVNDFDESGQGSPALDLARMAVSIVLADPSPSEQRASAQIESFVGAWHEAQQSGELGPMHTHDEDHPVRKLLSEAADGKRDAWLDKRVETAAGQRRFKESDKYQRVTDAPRVRAIEAALAGYGGALRELGFPEGWPRVLDVATRVAGTGSLGRFRWAVLVESKKNKRGKERVLELKEALPSSLEPARKGDPAAHVIAQQRLLQGAVPAFLGVAQVDTLSCSVRELQPTEAKVDVQSLHGEDLTALCGACGTALGRLHRRGGSKDLTNTGVSQSALTRATVTFALRYAELVRADHALLKRKRQELEHELGL